MKREQTNLLELFVSFYQYSPLLPSKPRTAAGLHCQVYALPLYSVLCLVTPNTLRSGVPCLSLPVLPKWPLKTKLSVYQTNTQLPIPHSKHALRQQGYTTSRTVTTTKHSQSLLTPRKIIILPTHAIELGVNVVHKSAVLPNLLIPQPVQPTPLAATTTYQYWKFLY